MCSRNDIQSILSREGFYLFTGNGMSMWPLIRPKTDTVEVRPLDGAPRRGDVLLFRTGDSYTLHRLLSVQGDNFITRGDNCASSESVSADNVLGVMTALWRGERKISLDSFAYRTYVKIILDHPRLSRLMKTIIRKGVTLFS